MDHQSPNYQNKIHQLRSLLINKSNTNKKLNKESLKTVYCLWKDAIDTKNHKRTITTDSLKERKMVFNSDGKNNVKITVKDNRKSYDIWEIYPGCQSFIFYDNSAEKEGKKYSMRFFVDESKDNENEKEIKEEYEKEI